MMQLDDYIPVELYHEAKDFVQNVSEDVEMYVKIKQLKAIQPDEDADKFVAYWNLERYEDFPHALITLYENKYEIDSAIFEENLCNAFEVLQQRMKAYYLLLKENGMIND